jgi:hypothetical protein
MDQQPTQPQPPDDEIPPQLRADLRALYGTPPAVPPEIDARLVAMARQRLTARRRPWLLWTSGAAAAAGLLLAAWLALHPAGYQRRGDILDAFYLARQIQAGSPVDRQWDINGDGRIDRRDVDALAASAVDLKRIGPAAAHSGGTL